MVMLVFLCVLGVLWIVRELFGVMAGGMLLGATTARGIGAWELFHASIRLT